MRFAESVSICHELSSEEFGGLDILVNNVGTVAVRLGGFASVTDDQWLSSSNLNFMAAVRTTRAPLTPMLRRNGGVIVTVSSVNSFLLPSVFSLNPDQFSAAC